MRVAWTQYLDEQLRTWMNCCIVSNGLDMVRFGEEAHGIVQKKHYGRGVPGPSPAPEQHLADITDVADLGMAEAELPENE